MKKITTIFAILILLLTSTHTASAIESPKTAPYILHSYHFRGSRGTIKTIYPNQTALSIAFKNNDMDKASALLTLWLNDGLLQEAVTSMKKNNKKLYKSVKPLLLETSKK